MAAFGSAMFGQPVDRQVNLREGSTVLSTIMNGIQTHKIKYQTYLAELRTIEALYRGQVPASEDPARKRKNPKSSRANLSTLELHRDVESVVSATDAVEFADDPFFEPYTDELSDDAMDAAYRTKTKMDQQHYEMKLRQKLYEEKRWGCLYGTAVARVTWMEASQLVEREGAQEPGWYPEGFTSGPDLKHVPMWRFYWAPDGATVRECSWVAEEVEMTRDQLVEILTAAKAWKDMKEQERDPLTGEVLDQEIIVKGLSELNLGRGGGGTTNETKDSIDSARGFATTGDDADKFTCHLYWGVHPTKRDKQNAERRDPRVWYILVVDGKDIGFEMPNPHTHGMKPYVDWRLITLDESFTGLGMGHILKRTQLSVNERMNLMSDLVSLSLGGMFQRRGAPPGIASAPVKVYPGRVFDDTMDGIMTPLPINTSGMRGGLELIAMDKEDMRIAVGATPTQQALSQGGTATETRTIASEGARRMASIAVSFSEGMTKPILYFQDWLNQQYLPEQVGFTWHDRTGNMVPFNFHKSQMLPKSKFKMKVATDLEFRPRLMRNLNTAMQSQAQLLSFGQANPALMPILMSVVLPPIIQMTKKNMLMFGLNPNEAMPPAVTRALLQMVQAPQQPALASPPGTPPGGGPSLSADALLAAVGNQMAGAGAAA